MDAAEVDGKAGESFLWLRAFDGFRQLPDADRSVVVDAGRFGGLQLGIAAWVEPLASDGFVVESYGADGACRVSVFAGLAARRIGAEQTACGFFLEVHSFVHSVNVRMFRGDKNRK